MNTDVFAMPLPAGISRRRLIVCGAALGAVPLLPACSRSKPHRIGFLGGLTGRMADLGVGGRNGAQLAIDHLNAAGGVEGRLFELLIKDDEQNDATALKQLHEFAQAGVAVVIGPMTSAVAIAVRAQATAMGLVLISPTASAPTLVGQPDTLFCLAPNAQESGRQHGEFLFRQGFRSLATLVDSKNKAFSDSWAQSARKRFEALGGRLGAALQFESVAGVNYGTLAQQLVDARAEALLLVANATDTAMLAQQIRRRDERVALAASAWAAHDQLLQMGGRAVEGMFVAQLFDRSSTAVPYQKFVAEFRQRFSDAPGYRSVSAYNAVMLGAEALRRQEKSPSQSVLEALRSVHNYPGLQHTITLDANGDTAAPVYATRVRNGQFETVPLR